MVVKKSNLLVMLTQEPSLQVNSSNEQPVSLRMVVYEEEREHDLQLFVIRMMMMLMMMTAMVRRKRRGLAVVVDGPVVRADQQGALLCI